jgi:stage III sporulation protein AH
MIINGRKLFPWLVLILLLVFASSIAERSMNKMTNIAEFEQNLQEQEEVEDKSMLTFAPQEKSLDIQADFFVDYKLERDRIRSKQIELFRELINSPQASEETTEAVKELLMKLSDLITYETELENLIKANGFSDAVVIIHDNSADVVIKSESLNQEQVVQVSDLVNRITGTPLEGIRVIPRL